MRQLRHRVTSLDCKYCLFMGNFPLPTVSYTRKHLKRFPPSLKCQMTAYSSDIMVLLSPLFFCRFIKEVCYSVNCLMSKYIPFLSRIYFICNLHPHTFHPHETHLDYNYTFPQGSSMILIFAMCPGRWMRTKGMGASKSLHKSSLSVRSRMWWPYHKVLFFLSLFVCFSKRRITIILRKPDFSWCTRLLFCYF